MAVKVADQFESLSSSSRLRRGGGNMFIEKKICCALFVVYAMNRALFETHTEFKKLRMDVTGHE